MSYKSLIQGPVIPVPTPFNEDESIDYGSLKEYVIFLDESGIPGIMTTVGTSRYNLLSWEEITAVNEVVAKNCKSAQSIVANPVTGSLKNTIEIGKKAHDAGADYYLVYFPERHYSEANTIRFFENLNNELEIKILIHEMPMRNGLGPGTIQYSLDLLKRLFEFDQVVGLKEEALDFEYSNRIVKVFSNNVLIIGAGGGMSRYFSRDFNLGARSYLGGIGNFDPKLELEFYRYMMESELERARYIVENIEKPFFDAVVPYGWHPSLKVAISSLGYMKQSEREPMVQLDEDVRKKIIVAVNKVLDSSYSNV